MRSTRRRMRPIALLAAAAALTTTLVGVSLTAATPASASVAPSGFQDTAVLTGLTEPTAVQFAPDGRVFVAEKSGIIKVFHGLGDPAPTIFADLRTEVHNFWDRGLLGLALDPQFSSGRPYVYVLYTYDAAIGGTAPTWGSPGVTSDGCPNPPGATGSGCVVSGRLSRLTANGDAVTGPEQVLVKGWCQQFPSHSMGTLAFGADGQLYASAGDGASFMYEDHGQTGNACQDPAGSGGALRSQSLRGSGPAVLNGSIVRLDPATGRGSVTNAQASKADPNAARIVADGLRNPYRFTIRPGTNEVWAGDVGWNTWEEINRLPDPTAPVRNFGWPCYEGNSPQNSYSVEPLCQNLAASTVTAPYFTYNHAAAAAPGDGCTTGSSSITGMAFHQGGTYPTSYDGALFFADYSRHCIWVMPKGANGLPDPARVRGFISNAAGPVALTSGPGGDLFYVDLTGGTIHRVTYTVGNSPPVASLESSTLNGAAPLGVLLDASGSTDPDPGDTLTYSWDTNGDGVFGDVTGLTVSTTFTTPGMHPVAVRVTDNHGASSVARLSIAVGPGAPVITVAQPVTPTHWSAGDRIDFLGSATDPTDGVLPASALSWSVHIEHCPSNCHEHPLQDFPGVAQGSFVAPDHEYPSYLTLTVTAKDSIGLSTSRTLRLDPATSNLTVLSSPPGLSVAIGGETATTPFTRAVIVKSTNSITALAPQISGGRTWAFGSWSDSGNQGHDVVAGTGPTTLTARYGDAGAAGAVPHLALSSSALTVQQALQSPPTPGTLTISNTGGAALHVASLTVDDPHFTATGPGNCSVVAPGTSCAVAVTFTPTAVGTVTSRLTIADDDGGVAVGTSQHVVDLTGSSTVADPLADKWRSLGGAAGPLGAPVGTAYDVPSGRAQNYTGGRIYWSRPTGAHEVHGLILSRYLSMGGPSGLLGLPTTDEVATPGMAGRMNTFTGGTVYWSAPTGAHEVHGMILGRYVALGGPAGLLGLPTTDETPTATGRSNGFTGGTVYWSSPTGAHEVHGLIRSRYLAMGGPGGLLGFPKADEAAAPGGAGRTSTFAAGVIFWSGATGAHEVHGAILATYRTLGTTSGGLGYPTTDEYAVTGGRRNDFQHGTLVWSSSRGTTSATYR